MKSFSLSLLALFLNSMLYSQLNEPYASGKLYEELKKLKEVSTVLYIAAHPDDENTRLISYFANERRSRTAYLSLTRGDGGQNLIGTEKGAALGVLRTQELLEARRVDGGEQYFSRAVDFGYSKNPKETFKFWDRDQVLNDVVKVIRSLQPDVIITRFPPTSRAGHGHHTASAIMAHEGFVAAADSEKFKDQLSKDGLKTWQAERIYFNASTWWDKNLKSIAAESDDYVAMNIGEYNPNLGLSYGEMAAESRSMHKSQGFGSARRRGEIVEYLRHTDGSKGIGKRHIIRNSTKLESIW